MKRVCQRLSTGISKMHAIEYMISPRTLNSSSSDLYSDDKEYLKVFKNDTMSCRLFKNEKFAYESLNKIKDLEPYIPKLIDSNSINNKYLLVENRGQDGICIINGEKDFTYDIWKKYLTDI